MAEIEEINTLLETETAKPQLESPERSDIDIIYEKNQNKSEENDSASYEVAHYDGVDEKFYDDLDLGFETSVEQMALDRENERAVFRNTDDSYEVLEVLEASSGRMAMKGKIYGQEDTWAMVYDSEDETLQGKNLSTGEISELNDPNLMNKAEMLKASIVHSQSIMEKSLREGEYDFVKTDRMSEDFNRHPEAEELIWNGTEPVGKLQDVKQNLESLTSIEPRHVFTKECTGPMKPGLQLVYEGYRFLFHDGSRTNGLDNNTFYGLRAFSKDRSEQRDFADELLEKNIGFEEYAEEVLSKEEII